MLKRSDEAAVAGMPIARVLSRSHLTIAIGYVAGYVLLDWVSYVHPFAASGITPWNPQTGLSFALILLFGIEFIPWLFVAPFLADLVVRGSPLPLGAEVLVVLAIGCGYGAATALLLSPRVAIDQTLGSMRPLLWLLGVALVSAALVGAGHAFVLIVFGILASGDFIQATLLGFIGDIIGVAVFTPFLLIVLTRRRFPLVTWEAFAILLLIFLAIAIVFGVVATYRLQIFYVLFLPIIWAAVRFGLDGVTAALVTTQIGLIAAIQLSEQTALDVTSYQALMVVLAFTALALGVLVDEQRRAGQRLRFQQEALNRAARLSTMGEFAAVVAHEINQPLMAIANYARLAKRAAEVQPPDSATAVHAANSAIEQVDRAAEVVRRLREFIRQGRTEVTLVTTEKLAVEAQSFCRPLLERHGVEISLEIARDLPSLRVDALQIEQVIVNLVLNSVEALAEAGRHDGKIVIGAVQRHSAEIEFSVRDNGPGFYLGFADEAPTPFATTKPEGLGLGLSLARSIVEAHGGKLTIASSPRGAIVSFTLPSAASASGINE
jgi:two-component system, LuxR family, sensor kinase FixL